MKKKEEEEEERRKQELEFAEGFQRIKNKYLGLSYQETGQAIQPSTIL